MIQQGKIREADAVLGNIKEFDSLIEQLRTWLFRMETAYKLGRTGEAAKLYDSARTTRTPIPGSTVLLFGNAISGYGPAFGRLTEFDSVMTINLRSAPPQVAPYQRQLMRLVVGVVNDSLVQSERDLFELTRTNRGVTAATRTIAGTLRLGLRLNRPSWPEIDTTIQDLQLRPAIALARGDTAALRLAARALDSAAHTLVALVANDSGFTAIAAEAYLALRDTAAALRTLRFGLDEAAATAVYFPVQSQGLTSSALVPRMLLLRADLAAATGARDEAREFYRRFIDAFSYAMPELQPLVERARKARAALAP